MTWRNCPGPRAGVAAWEYLEGSGAFVRGLLLPAKNHKQHGPSGANLMTHVGAFSATQKLSFLTECANEQASRL